MYDEYDGYEDDYPPQYRRPRKRRRTPLQWKLVVAAVLVVFALGARFCSSGRQRPPERPERMQVVKVVNWQAVDVRIRAAVEDAHAAGVRHAETAVGRWTRELRERVDNDFLPWYFAYWNQQALALKAIGYHIAATPLVEGLTGNKQSARERLGLLIEESFAARVLQPQSAQLKTEKITRESVEIYLLTLGDQLSGLQAEFGVPVQEWHRHLQGMSILTLAIEGNRQVPVISKAAVTGSGVAVAKLVRVLVGHIRGLVLRVAGRELLEDGMRMGGRYVVRGLGWWIAAGMTAWDVADHHRTVQQNLPVLRRSLNGYLDELEQQILHDPETGIIQILDGVQRDVLRELEEAKE
jgi:hypothetical protein